MRSLRLRFFRAFSTQTPVKETIARGVANGQLAYVGKSGSGKYQPFNFKRTISALDIEISEDMFVITKESAETYESAGIQPIVPEPSETGSANGLSLVPPVDIKGDAPLVPKPTVSKANSEAEQLSLGLTWSGEVPSQKWMNFYTKVLTKLGTGNDLSLSVKVVCQPKAGLSKQKMEEIRSALRELGLDDRLGRINCILSDDRQDG